MDLVRVLSVAALPPFGLLLCAVLLSFSYRYCKTVAKSPSSSLNLYFKNITTLHAFATEGMQAMIIGAYLYHALSLVRAANLLCTLCGQHDFERCLLMAVCCVGVVILHAAAVYGVDIAESRILLGIWSHPYGWRVLVITQSIILRRKMPWKTANNLCRKERMKGSVLQGSERLKARRIVLQRQAKWASRGLRFGITLRNGCDHRSDQWAKLDYLDLATVSVVTQQKAMAKFTPLTTPGRASNGPSIVKCMVARTEQMPTPPRSCSPGAAAASRERSPSDCSVVQTKKIRRFSVL